MGMFSAWRERAKNGSTLNVSSKIKAKKNKIVMYLRAMSRKRRDRIISQSFKFSNHINEFSCQRGLTLKKEIVERTKRKTKKMS